MIFCPLKFFQQIAQVAFNWNVVFPGLQLIVKVFIVDGVLLQHNTVTNQEIGQAIRCYSAIDIYLILMLQKSISRV